MSSNDMMKGLVRPVYTIGEPLANPTAVLLGMCMMASKNGEKHASGERPCLAGGYDWPAKMFEYKDRG